MSEFMGTQGGGAEQIMRDAAANFSRSIQEAADRLLSRTTELEVKAQHAAEARSEAEAHSRQELSELSDMAQQLQSRLSALAGSIDSSPSEQASTPEAQPESTEETGGHRSWG